LQRAYCEHFEQFMSLIRSHNLNVDQGHELGSEQDLVTLLESDFGIAFAPRSIPHPDTLKQAVVNGVEFRRTIYLYGVAGRERTCGGIGHFEIAARGRLVASHELACASQRCDHAFHRHALAIIWIDEASLDLSILADDEGSRDGKHPRGIALVIRDIPTER
jgi:hypothetical protein